MNIGTATRAAGEMPRIICWIMNSGWPTLKTKTATVNAAISGIIIGKPSSSSTTMVIISVAVMPPAPASRRKGRPPSQGACWPGPACSYPSCSS